MDPVSLFLLTIAGIFLIGIIGELVFERTGIPDVIWLILVGILLGPVSGLVERSQLMTIAPYFGALTLVVVLFDGGSELRLRELSQSAVRGSVLAVLGFVVSVAVLTPLTMAAAWAGWLPEGWGWMQSLLVGTILGGSSSVVIMPALRKAGLVPRIANVVNLESALTDVLSVVATGACIRIAMVGSADLGEAGMTLGRSFGIGIGIGGAAGMLSLFFLRRLKRSAYAYPLTLGTLLVIYVLIDELGGSAALGILTVAVLVGNAPTLSKAVGLARQASIGRGVENVHDQITFIIKSFFFTFIGTMLGPPWELLALGVGLGVVLLIARIPAAYLGTYGGEFSSPARKLVVVALPRGMAAGVLAMMPYQAGIAATQQMPTMIFATVFTTILIFTAGFATLKRRLPANERITLPAAGLSGGQGAADASQTFDPSASIGDGAVATPNPHAAETVVDV